MLVMWPETHDTFAGDQASLNWSPETQTENIRSPHDTYAGDREITSPYMLCWVWIFGNQNLGTERRKTSYPIRCRVCVRYATSECAPIANGTVGDATRDPGEKILTWIWNAPVLDRSMRYARTDGNVVHRCFNADQFLDSCDVYQKFWLSQSQVEHRAQCLTPGQDQGVTAL